MQTMMRYRGIVFDRDRKICCARMREQERERKRGQGRRVCERERERSRKTGIWRMRACEACAGFVFVCAVRSTTHCVHIHQTKFLCTLCAVSFVCGDETRKNSIFRFAMKRNRNEKKQFMYYLMLFVICAPAVLCCCCCCCFAQFVCDNIFRRRCRGFRFS